MRHSQPSPAKSTAEDSPPEEEAAKYKKKLESLLEAHHSLRASEQSARDRIGRLLDRQKQDQWAMAKYVDLLAENRALKARLDALESRVSEESAATASLTSKCEELEAVIAFLDDEIAASRANARRHEELEARVGEIGELERTIEELRARALILEAETASSARKLMEEEAANGRLKRRCEELEARVLSLKAEKSSSQSKCEKLDAVVVLEDDNVGSARKLVAEVEEKDGEIAPHIIEIDDHSSSEKDFVKILTPNRSRVSKVVLSDYEEEDDEDNTPIAKLMKQGNGRNIDQWTEDFDDGYVRTPMPSSTCRRKFASRVVTSDSEDGDDDDNIPISKLKRPRIREAEEESEQCCPMENVTPMRRLVRAGEEGTPTADLAGRNLSHTKTSRRYPREQSTVRRRLGYSCLDSEDDEEKGDDVEIDNDGDNIDEFIVSGSGSDSLEARSTTSDSFEAPSISDDPYDEELASDVDIALRNVLDKYYRKMNVKRWEYETDMLASFPKDPQLCMTAVCALYRQQTDEEQKLKGTIVVNGRGFNQFDAVKGSMIAEFLLDGDTYGPVKKTVKELKMRYPEGLDYCLTLAYRYSKQLFAIYQLKEDPYFSS